MIYKIAAAGFILLVGAICYTCSVVASMADDEYEEMMRDAWINLNQTQNQTETDSKDVPDASANQK